MQKLHPKAVWIFFFHFLGVGFMIPIILFFISGRLISIGLSVGKSFLIWLIPIFIFYIVLCYVWAKLTYRFWGYQLAENALKIERGVIWKKYVSIPYERIQNVDIHRGIIARILGLSDLQIQTAGFSATYSRRGFGGMGSEGRLPGLDRIRAEELREELIGRVKGAKQGL